MAVYTKVSDAEAAQLLAAYDIGAFKSLTGIKSGIENTNYILTTDKGPYILTLYERRTKEEDLPFFLNLMEFLAKRGVPCPQTVRAKDGQAMQRVADRPAAITTFLQGKPAPRIAPDECAELGRAMAKMHLAGEGFPLQRPNTLVLPDWEKLFAACAARADEVQQGLSKALRDELEYLHVHWPEDLPSGVIHADLFPDNVFFDGTKLCGMIDFYFACNDMLAYDLAICLNAWCFEPNNAAFNITKARALLRGYQDVRSFSAEEKRALPLLARGSSIRFLLTRLYDWLNQVPDAFVKPKDPLDYFSRLQFHQRVKDVTAYGIDA